MVLATKNYYTRSGDFHIDGQGYLVTDSGDKVLCKNKATNALEPIFVGDGKLQVISTEISQLMVKTYINLIL